MRGPYATDFPGGWSADVNVNKQATRSFQGYVLFGFFFLSVGGYEQSMFLKTVTYLKDVALEFLKKHKSEP